MLRTKIKYHQEQNILACIKPKIKIFLKDMQNLEHQNMALHPETKIKTSFSFKIITNLNKANILMNKMHD